jgi:hypothetical protein
LIPSAAGAGREIIELVDFLRSSDVESTVLRVLLNETLALFNVMKPAEAVTVCDELKPWLDVTVEPTVLDDP